MVRTRVGNHASINKAQTKIMIDSIFGRTLILRSETRTVDAFGQLSVITHSDQTFTGDLQYGIDLDQRYISSGIIEVGQGVLYIHPDELASLPEPQDVVIDGNAVWEVLDRIEAPELQGSTCHYSFKCRRRVNSSDD